MGTNRWENYTLGFWESATGGTMRGTARYLKEQNPNIKVWGIDSYGSVFKKYKETGIFDEKEIYPYVDSRNRRRHLARKRRF